VSTKQSMAEGRFITFEGIDGAGKSTQIAAAIEWVRSHRHEVIQSREPGGTPLGEKLRALLLQDPMHLETEALLMFAARREHLAQVIEPALMRGTWVVCDRFSDASFAYQAGGRGLSEDKFRVLETWTHPTRQPDLTFLFDLSPQVAAQRLAVGREQADRFEREKKDFFERVRAAYLVRARDSGGRIVVIDADRDPQVICAEVLRCLEERFA
jgi:dTMP kinase